MTTKFASPGFSAIIHPAHVSHSNALFICQTLDPLIPPAPSIGYRLPSSESVVGPGLYWNSV